jgi:hypothetical protein
VAGLAMVERVIRGERAPRRRGCLVLGAMVHRPVEDPKDGAGDEEDQERDHVASAAAAGTWVRMR